MLTAAAMSMVLLAFSVPLGISIWNSAADRALAQANSQIQNLGELIGVVDRKALALAVDGLNSSGQQVSVYLSDGSQLGRSTASSSAASDRAAADSALELAKTGRSLTAQAPGGVDVLYAVSDRAGTMNVVRGFVPEQTLRAGVVQAWLWLAALATALFLLGLLLANKLAITLLKPIRELVSVSERVAGGDLEARVQVAGPEEIKSLGSAHNNLADRIQELLQEERERGADLSHRLRTPLTSLQLEIDGVADEELAARLGERMDALEQAVNRSIRHARLSKEAIVTQGNCQANELIAERLHFWTPLAEDTGRTLRAGKLAEVSLPVAPDEFEACIDVIFQNFFTHTPEGAEMEISLFRGEQNILLLVRDNGAGFATSGTGEPLTRGVSGSGSTGLGLDIVARTAERSGGRLELSRSPAGGAELRIYFRTAPIL